MPAARLAQDPMPLPAARNPTRPVSDTPCADPAAAATDPPARGAEAAELSLEFWYFCDEGSAFRSD